MQRGSATLFVLLIVLILLGGVGWYYFNKQSFSTNKPQNSLPQITKQIASADKTYQNNNLNFELKYQKDLTVKENSEEDFNKRGNGDFRKNFKEYVGYELGKFAGAVVVLDKSNDYDKNPFTIWVFNNPNNLTIEEWYQKYWYYPFVWGDFTYDGKLKLSPKNEATVSGKVGKLGMVDYQPGKPKFIYIENNGKIYLFRIIGEEGNKILSTFRFLNNQLDETANWKTYTNTILDFSIKHPESIVLFRQAFSDGSVTFVRKGDIDLNGEPGPSLALSILRRGSLGESVENAVKSETCGGCIVTTEQARINNAIGVRTTSGFATPENYYLTDSERKGSPIRIYLSYFDNSDKKTIETFRLMLQTFKFER